MPKTEQDSSQNGIPTDPLAQRLRELGKIGIGAGALILAWSIVTEMSAMQESAVNTLSSVITEDMKSSQTAIRSLMQVLNLACDSTPTERRSH